MPQHRRFGLGLRKPHYAEFLETQVPVDFVEVISENFMLPGGRPRDVLRRVRERYPVALHGVSMSVGSADGIDRDYLGRLRALVDAVEPMFVSDHLCWTRFGGFQSHDLLPLPYTEEALRVVCDNVDAAQNALGRTILIENPSSYLAFAGAEMSEWAFLDALCARTDCELLLDVNNMFVSAMNHGFDPQDYLAGLPTARVRQIHLAGHSEGETMLIDTHDRAVQDAVWDLYAAASQQIGAVATMIERDDAIPPLADLLTELGRARSIAAPGIAA
ncbi:MNIO family bufferin maturase [Sphingomonas sp. RS6]